MSEPSESLDATPIPDRRVVLVVDDVPENLAIAHALLRPHYRIKVATGGEQALEMAQKWRPDLILLDIMMPDMDGYEVCRRLKAHRRLGGIPIIFLTARADQEDEQLGFALGAVDYVAKPFTPAIVLARVRAQIALKDARDALERRIRVDKRRFELALGQQIEINALRSKLLVVTSHEFRTPLTAILSSQELLRVYGERMPKVDRDDTLSSIGTAANRMLAMLDQLLAVGREDTTMLPFHPHPVSVAEVCHQIRDEVLRGFDAGPGGMAPEIDLDLRLDDSLLPVDETLLHHSLGNLLSNALKYSLRSRRARLAALVEGNVLIFEVVDEGIGIPAKDLPLLFGEFYRASNVGTIPGTGLGLSIAKRAIESHGGRITVDSVLGSGTVFRIRIPLSPA